MIEKVNVQEKFDNIDTFWDPKQIGALNGQQVKAAKFKGEFVMHHHEHEDELFYVVEGTIFMELEDRVVEINQGEFVIIPKGVRHKPSAFDQAKVLIFEPASTLNTGNVVNELTKRSIEKI